MTLLENIKPFWPLLFTFVLPRAINYYRVVKTAIRTRPPPRPLPKKTGRGLNVLFAAICVFLYASLPFRGNLEDHNIFVVTQSRISLETDTLFTRLALFREGRVLTPIDEALRFKLGSQALRQIYLRFGPSTLLNCSFCQSDDQFSYLLYHLPNNVLLPHLFHILCIGLATSETVSGFEASRWRRRTLLGVFALASIDVAMTSMFAPIVDSKTPAPAGIFWTASTLRCLVLCLFDAIIAFLIYASATGRFLLFTAGSATDSELVRRRTEELLKQANLSLQVAQTNLRAYAIARNAVVRNPGLKGVDDEYWRAVVAMEGPERDEALFEDEEVQAAVARAYGSGTMDVAGMKKEAEVFVKNVTRGLEATESAR
ncbi:uncharacterized protein Z518_10862 [Rhinocladiella mackenziei CBS 650.93]|uniref:Uncharacterized protein n=1 Tax=Rhinocladiella mackenziei CBS 650.93 TaxID=1442369 RepID=A0A0D2IT84_9EURO|nr:uncharacterized protein Z518_10862 [Rhinocladiella mackenziei CBS 650.93]KIW99934.1 hypothetical protein Z518_10862 [Rhinocladiella mackenziei CBS 650.93]